jgi:hypothetical protein
LAILGLGETERDPGPISHQLDREQVTPIDILAIDGDRIYLLPPVPRPNVAIRRLARRHEIDLNDLPPPRRPFALHSEEARSNLEDEVVAAVLELRPEDLDAELDRRGRNCNLGHVPLMVAVVHEQMFVHEATHNKTQASGRCESARLAEP